MSPSFQRTRAEIQEQLKQLFPDGTIPPCDATALLAGALLSPLKHVGPVDLSERRGMEIILSSDLVPLAMSPDRFSFEKLGFNFGKIASEGGGLLIHCSLPQGWSKSEGSETRFSFIRDASGRKRAEIFYKDSPYEKKASMRLLPEDYKD